MSYTMFFFLKKINLIILILYFFLISKKDCNKSIHQEFKPSEINVLYISQIIY